MGPREQPASCHMAESQPSSYPGAYQKTKYHRATSHRWIALQTLFLGWWIELACIFIIWLAMFATAITLSLHQGQPLPQWPFNISINSLIAIYAVVFKAALLLVTAQGLSQLKWAWFSETSRRLIDLSHIDAASRGPWGSIELIATFPKNLTMLIGALVTIGAVLVDPFAQLIVHFEECQRPSSATQASIPRRNTYAPFGGHEGAGISSIDGIMQSNIIAGVMDSIDVDFNCPSGNCRFASSYYSLGYCSTCTDVTQNLTFSCDTYGCNASLPSGTAVTPPGWSSTVNRLVANLTTQGYEMIKNGWSEGTPNVSHVDEWDPAGFGAASCVLTPCVYEYLTQMQAGKLNETILSTSAEFREGVDATGWDSTQTLHLDCLPLAEYRAFSSMLNIEEQEAKSGWVGFNFTLEAQDGDKYIFNNNTYYGGTGHNISLSSQCVFVFGESVLYALGLYLSDFFSGNVTSSETSNYLAFSGPAQLQALYNFGMPDPFENIKNRVAGVAKAITSHIRQSSIDTAMEIPMGYQSDAIGVVLEPRTCIVVRWGWIALPVTLMLLTSAFFIATVVTCSSTAISNSGKSAGIDPNDSDDEMDTTGDQSQRQMPLLWKESILAPIFHGLLPASYHRATKREARTGLHVVPSEAMAFSNRIPNADRNDDNVNDEHREDDPIRHVDPMAQNYLRPRKWNENDHGDQRRLNDLGTMKRQAKAMYVRLVQVEDPQEGQYYRICEAKPPAG